MKKWISLLLVICMLFSLTACDLVDEVVDTIYDVLGDIADEPRNDNDDDDDDDDDRGGSSLGGLLDDKTPGTSTDNKPADQGSSGVAGDRPGNTTTDIPAVAIPDTPEKKEYSRGLRMGNMYENEFFGMGVRLPNGWSFYDEDYMKNLNNATADILGEDFEKLLQNATIIYEIMAVDETTGMDNLNINLEKLTAYQAENLDVGDNYNALKSTMKSMLENAGYTVTSMRVTTVEVAGKTFDALVSEGTVNGISMQQISFAFVCSEYLVNFTVSSFNNPNGAYEMLNYFYAV